MRQFHNFKQQYPDAILFFRMGDFYETFYDDARICARVLGITLTSRGKGESAAPLAGVPHHAVTGYLNKMIKAGYKVAICEQVEDPAQAKGVVKRDVVRLVTPGTLTEDSLLEEREGNFLAAVCFVRPQGNSKSASRAEPEQVGIAWVELSTGQFFAELTESRFVLDELARLHPAECVISDDTDALPENFARNLRELTGAVVTTRAGYIFERHTAFEALKKHFRTASLEGFGFEGANLATSAAGAVIDYLNETQKTALEHISRLQRISRENYLQLDQTTLRSLEVERTIRDGSRVGSLLHSIDQTVTALGGRQLRQYVTCPLYNLPEIERRQDAVAELLQMDELRRKLRACLGDVADIERITSRVSTGRTSPRDLLGLGRTLRQMPLVKQLLSNCTGALLGEIAGRVDTLDLLADLLEASLDPEAPLGYRDGGVIRSGFNEEVDRLRSLCRDGQSWLAEYQQKLIQQTGHASLKVGFNKVFGYYVEVSHAFRGELSGDFVRKQTLKNAERYITDELKKYESEALTAEHRCKKLEEELFQELRREVAAQTLHLQQIAEAVAAVDCFAALAEIARHRNYCRPTMHTDKDTRIIDGRHPVLDVTLGNGFVPNDVSFSAPSEKSPDPAADLTIITGPNMSGKSTYIRQTALLVLMAQMGSYIPASSATIGLVDRIFTRVGASDELTRGQSTFMVEMTETANIINNATDRSLVILDEIGRGTSTYDGLSLAWSIAEHIALNIKCRTLFATHYHEITELAELIPNIANSNVAVREWKDDVVFLHKIVPGRADRSYGIHVARLAGVPKNVLVRAREILDELERNFARESHRPELTGKRTPTPEGQLLLFDELIGETIIEKIPDWLSEKLGQADLNNMTPMQAWQLLSDMKQNLSEQ